MIDLRGKGVLVVGVRRQLGATVARRLAAEGMNVAISYRSSRDEAEEIEAAITADGHRACIVQGDVSIEADVQRMVQEASERMGGLWAIANLASDYPSTQVDHLTEADWDRGLAAAKGTYLLALAGAKEFERHSGASVNGHLIFIGDWAAGETPYKDFLPYLTAKAAIHFMTRAFAVELAPKDIRVNCIAPGPMQKPPDMAQEEWDHILQESAPIHMNSSVEDMAEMIVTLLKSETITGEVIRVDSGRHIAGTRE